MERDIGWQWKRDYMRDMPELIGEPTIPQQIGLITPEGACIQMSYDKALALGLIEDTEERWSMPYDEYLQENGLDVG